ncbi:MAG: hypothetical protein ACF8R7_05100 [Phycisphaerales bacterium JB039]
MKGRWQTMVGAALVAVLIWFFAEGRSLITVTRSGAVALVAPEQSRRVLWRLPDQAREFEIELTLTGSTATLDELARELQSPVILQPGVELPSDVNDHLVNLAEALRASDVFASRGIEIVSVEPAQVRIRVDELVDREVPVSPQVQGAELVGTPVATPDTVTVTLPLGLADQFIPPGTTVSARVGPESLAQRSGQTTVSGVRVVPPPAWLGASRLTISPQTVDVTFTLKDTIRQFTLKQVPVYVSIPAGQQGSWIVEVPVDQQYLRDVTVRGPSELIAQIEAGQLPVVATVKLTPDDLVAGPGAREATFGGWAGSVEFTAPSRRVEYELRPVAAPQAPGGDQEQ